MPTRIVEGKLPYTGGTGIGIDTNKVISLLLREENNLIMVNGDNEIYTDLQLAVNITPSSDFPVGVTVGKVLAEDGWSQNGLILNWKTTSGDYARWLYGADGKIYFDGGQGTWKQVYYSQEVDALFTALRGELATVAFTGDYNDLINRPAFLQVQADWNQTDTDAPDYIKNKPTIPTVNDATLTIQRNGSGVGTFTANSSTNVVANIAVPNVINNVTSTSTSDALSANQGKLLQDQIDDLKAMGRFLSLWDCETGLPISFPLSIPYNYQTGDYFLVENVDTTTNYRPSGVQYTGTASTTVETDEVEVGDLYIYDGSVWLLQINHGKSVSFANLAGQPSDNAALASALNAKANDSGVVHLAGDETITGVKTFGTTNTWSFDGTNAMLYSPSANGYLYVSRGGTVPVTMAIKSGASGGTFGTTTAHQFQFRTNDTARMTVQSTAQGGKVVLEAGSIPAAGDNSGSVPSTSWVNTAISNAAPGSATSSVAGIVKLGSDTVQNVNANAVSGTVDRTYAIQADSTGKMVVNVPWTTPVTSVNGATGAVTVDEGDAKVFEISDLTSAANIAIAQAAYDYAYTNKKCAIIKFDDSSYVYEFGNTELAHFTRTIGYGAVSNGSRLYVVTLSLTVSSGSVTAMSLVGNTIKISPSAPASGDNRTITFVI